VIVVATESHRDRFLLRLHAHVLDTAAAIAQGRYIALNAAETAATVMVNGLPDRSKSLEVHRRSHCGSRQRPPTSSLLALQVWGECAPLLWYKLKRRQRFSLNISGTRQPNHTVSMFSARIHCVAFRAGWAAAHSKESVQSIQPFISDESF
jgi:hypothetical protein